MPDLPDSLGVAGAFAGVHANRLIIAGGANFPAAMPWAGGKKHYTRAVYVLERSGHWQSFELDEPFAYGASVSLPAAHSTSAGSDFPGGIICLGGENTTGISRRVFWLRWDPVQHRPLQQPLPSLPQPLTNPGATAIGHIVYVAGGENTSVATDAFYSLDLDHPAKGWTTLPPLPLALSNAAVVAQAGRIFVIGGRTKTPSGISRLHGTVYSYDPEHRRWAREIDLEKNWSAGPALPVGDSAILLLGGDHGEIFHHIEQLNAAIANVSETASAADTTRRRLQQEKLTLVESHPGFSRDLWLYDVRNHRWHTLGQLPFPTAVTTTAVRWGDEWIIPSGEVKPGRRTNRILSGKFIGYDHAK